jgi:hypothetical protein
VGKAGLSSNWFSLTHRIGIVQRHPTPDCGCDCGCDRDRDRERDRGYDHGAV